MFQRVLIANRGEIALRILRACHTAGKEAVAVYTLPDKNLPHLKLAQAQVRISHYLNQDDVIMAAKTKGCDAIHPGYGLLSENAEFAAKVEAAGLTFIGPSSEHIALLGDKIQARQIIQEFGLPSIPGSEGAITTSDECQELAMGLGFPIVIKASAGGGGRGIRAVFNEAELAEVLEISRGEAHSSFGNDQVFVEKLFTNARHVEVQILGDGRGNCIHLGTRDCSIQRRYQKLVEEAPAPAINQEKLSEIIELCVQGMGSIQYRSAATFEFLYSGEAFYFLEVNTRLQVEHPVTEQITQQDIVALQLEIADLGKLPVGQADVSFSGSSIECRILAEDTDGRPSPGKITGLFVPGGPGIRFDSHLFVGYVVPHQYDSLVAKLVASGANRGAAIARMLQALNELRIDGIDTNVSQLMKIVGSKVFVDVTFSTNWKPE